MHSSSSDGRQAAIMEANTFVAETMRRCRNP